MTLAEINLCVIYILLKSDWLAQNIELEPRIPGSSTQTYFYLPPPALFRKGLGIQGKIRLARETRVRACVYVCVWERVCVPAWVFLCASVCVGVGQCV